MKGYDYSSIDISYRNRQEDYYGEEATIKNEGRIKGGFSPTRRAIDLPIANFDNEKDLRATIKHELIGHFGTLTFSKEEKLELLNCIADSNSESLRHIKHDVDFHAIKLTPHPIITRFLRVVFLCRLFARFQNICKFFRVAKNFIEPLQGLRSLAFWSFTFYMIITKSG